MTSYHLIKIEQEDRYRSDGNIMVVERLPGKIENLFGVKPREVRYYGNGLMWHEMESWKRCSGKLENILKNIFLENLNK